MPWLLLTCAQDDSEDWVNEDELEDIDRSKIVGLRLLTHHALTHVKDPEALSIVQPVLELLVSILQNEGMISEVTAEG